MRSFGLRLALLLALFVTGVMIGALMISWPLTVLLPLALGMGWGYVDWRSNR